ncbi:MAG: alpha/beta fold hydrolase [Intrasporangium sp.]|uniref:alpha/beta fold hydrolase n=1 Tax=Intrasporangium sp. TaxID=1925024 RepID=UPI003F7DEEA2
MSPDRRRNPVFGVGAALVGVAAGVAAGVVADRATKHRAAMLALDTRDTYEVVPDEERVVLTDDGVPLHVEIDEPDPAAAEAAARGLTPNGRADELPTIVLTHGYCLSLRCWVFQRRALTAAGYRVVSWDHRGHGKSGRGDKDAYVIERLARDLQTVIEEVAPTGDLVLVGHSMGGMTIMALGELNPELVRDRVIGVAFVSTSPGGITLANGGRSATIGRLLLERLGPTLLTPLSERPDLWSWVRRSGATLEEFLVDQNSFASPVAASLVRFTADILLGTPLDVINDYLVTFDHFDMRPALKHLRGAHVLVFNGKNDVLTPPQHSDLIVEGIPGAEHVLVNDAGHVIMLEHPDLLNAQLTQLIERAVRSRTEHLEVSQQPRVRRTVTNVAKERRVHATRHSRRTRSAQQRAGRGA